ncbi:MAG: exonuclease SbcCD subunit D [Lewinellaceae bacterium]|nr:exonuclease SbcCD subunit D [Lewinellaceae bacterium]
MRVIHFSDTHLGFQAFDVVNAEGVNAREQDVYDAFARVVDCVLDLKPDVVVHSGDFFHRPSPSNRALTFGLEQLRRICDINIPVVIIAGNHETPKTIYNSPILRAFRSLDCVVPVFGETWEQAVFGDLVVHGVPHINDNRLLFRELERMQPQPGKFNLLLLHTSLGKRFLMEEYGEQVYPEAFESKLQDFQYIALGHWHNYQQIDLHPNAWYSGSIERLSDTEVGTEKGFLVLDIDKNGSCAITFEAIRTRPWLKLDLNDCQSKTVAQLLSDMEQFRDAHTIDDAIISLNINDIKVEQTLELSNAVLRGVFPDCFQMVVKRRSFADRAFVHSIEANQFDRLDRIFAEYVRSKYSDDTATADRITDRAQRYFADTEK